METKVCRTCGEAVPLDGYYTSRGKPRPDCKSCTRKGQQEKRDRLKQRSPEEAITKTEKLCSKCNEVLPVSMFGLALINPDGLKSYCKPCESTISTDWLYAKEERRERYRFNTRQRRKADPEKFRAPLRLWRKNNPERHREIQQRSLRRYRASDQWKQLYKERLASGEFAARNTLRRARKLQAEASWADQEAIKAIYQQARFLTETTGTQWVIDHIDPLVNDLVCGLHVESNLEPITHRENASKWNKFTPYRIDADGNRYELSGEEWLIIK